jgi:hypothetical protein
MRVTVVVPMRYVTEGSRSEASSPPFLSVDLLSSLPLFGSPLLPSSLWIWI